MRKTLGRRSLLAAAVSIAGLASSAQAARYAPPSPMIDLQVVDRDTGETARPWRHGGRTYVAGRPGARYSLRVTNNSPSRVLAVMSVDGVNILTGETAGHGQRGYVLGPYESYDVAGWRKSDHEIAAFTFAPLSRSYAARTGRPNDVGVIGVAAFTERSYAPPPVAVSPPVSRELRRPSPAESSADAAAAASGSRARAAPAPAARSAAPRAEFAQESERLGTGHGEREWSTIRTVRFERATAHPQLIRLIEYDSYENLVARGVIPQRRPSPTRPQPFPSSRYVPDPPGEW